MSDDHAVIDSLAEQAADLCHIHDHITRVIANLDVPIDTFSGYDDPDRARFDLKPIVQTFIYQHARGFTQAALARRLRGAAYVYVRFGLAGPLSQQVISYTWRRRFSPAERRLIEDIAQRVHDTCVANDVVTSDEPALEPDDVQGEAGLEEDQIMDAVQRATDRGFDAFSADRASNATYPLQAFLERQGYLNMANAGATTPRRRFARLSDREQVPHGSTHNRTLKKIATPDAQATLDEYATGRRPPDWHRIRDAVLPAFHAGVDELLDEIAGRDRSGIREPVAAAIDITPWTFWPSPYRGDDDIEPGEEPTVVEHQHGSRHEVYLKDDYPEMVSGVKAKREHAYKFATLTIVAENTPLVLAIEPVRDERYWEDPEQAWDATTQADLVRRLLQQASQHVTIHKLFADRGFDSHEVRDVIDRRNIQYVLGRPARRGKDQKNIEEIAAHPVADVRVEHAWEAFDARRHKMSFIYYPSDRTDEEYAIFTTTGWITPDRAMGLVEHYRTRWQIENEYKTIKQHFLPTSASTDYRMRLLVFTLGVMLYNVWRLTNFLLRDFVAVDLGENPPLRAGEIVELVGICLFEPG